MCRGVEKLVIFAPENEGKVPEWSNGPDSKSGERLCCSQGLNPCLSASERSSARLCSASFFCVVDSLYGEIFSLYGGFYSPYAGFYSLAGGKISLAGGFWNVFFCKVLSSSFVLTQKKNETRRKSQGCVYEATSERPDRRSKRNSLRSDSVSPLPPASSLRLRLSAEAVFLLAKALRCLLPQWAFMIENQRLSITVLRNGILYLIYSVGVPKIATRRWFMVCLMPCHIFLLRFQRFNPENGSCRASRCATSLCFPTYYI